jgi:hypothetical protein
LPVAQPAPVQVRNQVLLVQLHGAGRAIVEGLERVCSALGNDFRADMIKGDDHEDEELQRQSA